MRYETYCIPTRYRYYPVSYIFLSADKNTLPPPTMRDCELPVLKVPHVQPQETSTVTKAAGLSSTSKDSGVGRQTPSTPIQPSVK